jgi:hypothetical protein
VTHWYWWHPILHSIISWRCQNLSLGTWLAIRVLPRSCYVSGFIPERIFVYGRQHLSKTILPSYVLQGRPEQTLWHGSQETNTDWLGSLCMGQPVAGNLYRLTLIRPTSVLVDRYYTIMGYILACAWLGGFIGQDKDVPSSQAHNAKAIYACEISVEFPSIGKERTKYNKRTLEIYATIFLTWVLSQDKAWPSSIKDRLTKERERNCGFKQSKQSNHNPNLNHVITCAVSLPDSDSYTS